MSNLREPSKSSVQTKGKLKQPGRAADFLVSQIEARILSDDLKDGENLPAERELMNQYGVSRTVVREAVAMLASKGMIAAKPRHRPVIRKPSYDMAIDAISGIVTHLLNQPGGVHNLFDTRIMLEASLVRDAALKADKDDIRVLREALQANQDAINDSQQFYATDVAFHAVLYAISGNPVLPAIHKAYTNWLAGHWKQMPRMPDRNSLNYAAHEAIFNAILSRDPDEAEAALRKHLAIAWEHVKKTFHDLD